MNRSERGFTLIELMIVVVIIGVIVAVALPNYTRQVQESRRGSVQSDMLDYSARLEQYRAQRFSYAGADGADGPAMPDHDFFNISLDIGADNASYEIQATPTGSMSGTGVLVLDHRGQSCFVPDAASCTPGDDPSWGSN